MRLAFFYGFKFSTIIKLTYSKLSLHSNHSIFVPLKKIWIILLFLRVSTDQQPGKVL